LLQKFVTDLGWRGLAQGLSLLQCEAQHGWLYRSGHQAQYFLASVQAKEEEGETPKGVWYMNYYANWMGGGFIPFDIDQVGLMLWTLWNHAIFINDFSERKEYLEEVWPTIILAAELMTDCKDESNNLQCFANEDGNPLQTQTLHGAMTVLLSLCSAVKASTALCGDEEQCQRWQDHADELETAIDEHLWDEEENLFVGENRDRPFPSPNGDPGWWVWPVHEWDYDDPRKLAHGEMLYDRADQALSREGEGALTSPRQPMLWGCCGRMIQRKKL
jgi:hypothetical protein